MITQGVTQGVTPGGYSTSKHSHCAFCKNLEHITLYNFRIKTCFCSWPMHPLVLVFLSSPYPCLSTYFRSSILSMISSRFAPSMSSILSSQQCRTTPPTPCFRLCRPRETQHRAQSEPAGQGLLKGLLRGLFRG